MARPRFTAAALFAAQSILTVLLATTLSIDTRVIAASSSVVPMPQQALYGIAANSPTLQFTPRNIGPASAGWNMTSSGLVPSTFYPNAIFVGNVAYTTTLNSSTSSVHVNFVGTAISVLGSSDNSDNVAITCDNDQSKGRDSSNSWQGELAWVRGLPWGLHSCDINVQMTFGQVVITELLVLTGIPDGVLRNAHDGPRTKVYAVEPSLTASSNFTGTQKNGSPWEPRRPDPGNHEEQGSFPPGPDYYYVLRTNTSGSSLSYKVPPRTSFIELWGSVGWGYANYTVTFTPAPPFNPPNGPYAPFSPYYSPWQVLSFTVLDPTVTYTLTVDTVSDGTMEIYGVEFFTDNGTTTSTGNGSSGKSSGITAGALAGGIVGGLVAGAAICAVIALVLFDQYKRKHKPVSAGAFLVDNPDVDPFPHTQPAADMAHRESVMTPVTGVRPLSPASPFDTRGIFPAPTEDTLSSSGSGGRTSVSHQGTGPLVVSNHDGSVQESAFTKSARGPSFQPQPRAGPSAPAPLPITLPLSPVQERDSGANIIIQYVQPAPVQQQYVQPVDHIPDHIPPAYDHARAPGTNTGP